MIVLVFQDGEKPGFFPVTRRGFYNSNSISGFLLLLLVFLLALGEMGYKYLIDELEARLASLVEQHPVFIALVWSFIQRALIHCFSTMSDWRRAPHV